MPFPISTFNALNIVQLRVESIIGSSGNNEKHACHETFYFTGNDISKIMHHRLVLETYLFVCPVSIHSTINSTCIKYQKNDFPSDSF